MDAMTANYAKAVKEYLEKFRMTVPKEIEDLAKGSTDKVLPADQKSAFNQYNANLRKPIWYKYCPLFEELWKKYINKYGQSQYTSELRRCVEDASDSLFTAAQNREPRPKLLLGYVQSGKTQAFAFIAARCFDLGFDICIILTANKIILKEQTEARFNNLFDISDVNLPDISIITDVSQKELDKGSKTILLVNKDIAKLQDLSKLDFAGKKVLVIDDEADVISRGFYKLETKVTIAKCAKEIEDLRKALAKTEGTYLAVTATCYNLILQPVSSVVVDHDKAPFLLSPFNPSEIFLLPTYQGYRGLDDFFERNSNPLHRNFDPEAEDDLKKAIYSYLVSSAILNHINSGYKSCCIVHLDTRTNRHATVGEVIEDIIAALKNNINETSTLRDIKIAYNDIRKTYKNTIPNFNEVVNWINVCLKNNHGNIGILNSEKKANNIQDGNVCLSKICNIFIGGFMLDRGITFPHLITFIYARRSIQRDTVMQHARFFGNRSDVEMSVTRLFMPQTTFEMMADMHILDKELRDIISTTLPGDRIAVLKSRTEEVCRKSKVLASDINKIRNAFRTILPKGMQINNATVAQANTDIDSILNKFTNPTTIQPNGRMYDNLSIDKVINILNQINRSYTYSNNEGNLGLKDQMDNIIKILSDVCTNGLNGNAPISPLPVVRWDNRDLSRKTRDGAWSTGVLTGKKGNNAKSDSEYAKDLADKKKKPVLVLTKQNGKIEKGWTGHEFYWPVIVFPQTKLACNDTVTLIGNN